MPYLSDPNGVYVDPDRFKTLLVFLGFYTVCFILLCCLRQIFWILERIRAFFGWLRGDVWNEVDYRFDKKWVLPFSFEMEDDMITFNKQPGQKILELGGGDNPHQDSDVKVDIRKTARVDFAVNFDSPAPWKDDNGTVALSSDEFDCVFTRYCLEHVSWRRVPDFLQECLRVLKPGGKLLIVTANTEEQMNFIKNNKDGWDGKGPYEAFSCVLFGDQDYPENAHKNFQSPSTLYALLNAAGFTHVKVQAWGARQTDMIVQAEKPKTNNQPEGWSVNRLEEAKQPGKWTGKKNEEDFDPEYQEFLRWKRMNQARLQVNPRADMVVRDPWTHDEGSIPNG